MTVRPKLSRATAAIIERKRRTDPRQNEFQLIPQELYREACEDADGNRYTVIVWRPHPGLAMTDYTLDDGSPVKFVDDCLFQIEGTGIEISRCA